MGVKVAVIYYSSTGHVHQLAKAIEEGAIDAGAEVRLRKVAELAPASVVAGSPDWAEHAKATEDVPEATLDDLLWADAYLFGSPTRYGNVAAQLKQFIDTTGGLWFERKLVDKVVSGFTSSDEVHGGQESTIISLYNVFMHWGAIIVTPGYADDVVSAAGGNPYGASSIHVDKNPTKEELAAANFQGRRVAEKAAQFVAGRG
ncbi:NAD(P)H:quinone oxidoreductase [Actinokineospora cianjurensis]|uniref:NAD(P)H dehydrogenase (Quinone) n=1 Tax=Actinokineospora cianjurensis TaxID=585224 RepID=A0A421AYX6_9PSEU|nr:NAD(P)H:quinone oxidoreductase [Actinokineospora cianjurensis]RLK54989.1 NAD(P)H dehydrogenase (quinone) [Actinokineospora cianjurensis]